MLDLVNRLVKTQIMQGLSEKVSGWPFGLIPACSYQSCTVSKVPKSLVQSHLRRGPRLCLDEALCTGFINICHQ